MSENKGNKANCHSPKSKRVPHSWIAETVGCSQHTVKGIRIGQRNNESDLAQRIEVAEILLEDGVNKLLAETKRVVQFK